LLPVLICKYVTTCNGWGIFGLFIAGEVVGLASLLPWFFYFLLSICITYTSRNIFYIINRCTCGLYNIANYAIDKLTNCCSRLAGLSGRDEQETNVESSSAEELSEITTSSSQGLESSEDINQTEQGQPQLSRRPSFASLMNPFSIFYRSEQVASETIPQGRRLSFTSLMNPFSFFRASSEETNLENSNMTLSDSDSDNSHDSKISYSI